MVLRALRDGPNYGYAISTALKEAGFGTIKGGTLYPLLGRLEADGLVTVEWRAGDNGPQRKFYRLSNAGRDHLATQIHDWEHFTALTAAFLTAPKG
ncbi:PadR family transcriptional regulator [Corynebacterium liangguodongii]|uniref:PadR family transcriptional regulator n=1 Tax=Corynebacterium liangguodongii TaxID=2079535 RepID=UPI0018EEC7E7|nr:helix-turn-helix transcriptional regulator [Corynebacterium liangguodongii]